MCGMFSQEIAVFCLVVLVDQLIKAVFIGQGWSVMFNQGIALGLLPSEFWIGWVMLILVYMMLKRKKAIGWWLVFGGGVSNLLDRVFRGGVVDIVSVSLLPAFNLADGVIVVGCLWLMASSFQKEGKI